MREQKIAGDRLRLDTTAVETNIHWPTDSSLLWDTYRVLARLIERARQIDPGAVGSGRLHPRRAKRDALTIARRAAQKGRRARSLKRLYQRLIRRVEGICGWATAVAERLVAGIESQRYDVWAHAQAEALVEEIAHFTVLGRQVLDQARRRVLQGESVPNDEKLFSIFEPHTELLKRGKAGKDIEFGHMIQIQQVGEKFITDYEVFDRKPVEPTLLDPALAQHKKLFGTIPEARRRQGLLREHGSAPGARKDDRRRLHREEGNADAGGDEREQDPLFRLAQAFRAGVEGTISFLKRMLRLARCFNKGWEHFVATVGQTIFAHNLLILARR